jgi:hypothetical protein
VWTKLGESPNRPQTAQLVVLENAHFDSETNATMAAVGEIYHNL